MKQKLVLALDSHMLSSFQRCPQEHYLAHVAHMEQSVTHNYYDKGSLVHLMLGLYYKLIRRGMSSEQAGMLVATKRFKRYCAIYSLEKDEEMLILSRFFEYVSHYNQEKVKVIGIETGFSEKIFEDKNFIFIYEGRVDWIGFEQLKTGEEILHFTDHKTRNQNYALDCFKNQFFGYAWMMKEVYGSDYQLWGKVNYFGLQEDKTGKLKKDGKLFEKVWFQFSEKQIEQWKKDTIWWFHRIAQSRMFNVFPRSWQCDRKVGVCDFKKICKAGSDWEKKLVLGGPEFKKRDKAWSAWEN